MSAPSARGDWLTGEAKILSTTESAPRDLAIVVTAAKSMTSMFGLVGVSHRLPNTLNVSFVGRVGADILGQLDGIAASTGSACHSGNIQLSPVLRAMGVTPEVGMGAIRFSLGRSTPREEVDRLAAVWAIPE